MYIWCKMLFLSMKWPCLSWIYTGVLSNQNEQYFGISVFTRTYSCMSGITVYYGITLYRYYVISLYRIPVYLSTGMRYNLMPLETRFIPESNITKILNIPRIIQSRKRNIKIWLYTKFVCPKFGHPVQSSDIYLLS